jgi:hypothetical protein
MAPIYHTMSLSLSVAPCVPPPPDLELLEGLDKSKHGERAIAVSALVKELEQHTVSGGISPRSRATVRVAPLPSIMGDNETL